MSEARESLYGTVKKVIDGDSLIVTAAGRDLEIRLYGIDAPEYNQPCGFEAKNYAKRWEGRQQVIVQPEDVDWHGRTVAIITKDGQVLNRELVESGWAWVYPRYCRKEICTKWTELEDVARNKRKGLWRDAKPIAPWLWRRKEDSR